MKFNPFKWLAQVFNPKPIVRDVCPVCHGAGVVLVPPARNGGAAETVPCKLCDETGLVP